MPDEQQKKDPIKEKPPATGAGQDALTEIKKGERWLLVIGALTLFLNAVIAYIYYQQLQEMVGVATQTDTLTRDSRGQARDIRRLADETHALAATAQTQAAASQAIAMSSLAQAEATKAMGASTAGQLSVMQQQLETSQRAWIVVDAITATQPIAFGKDNDRFSYGFSLQFHNAGNLPADGVGSNAVVTFQSPDGNFVKDPVESQHKVCQAAGEDSRRQRRLNARTLFPGEKDSLNQSGEQELPLAASFNPPGTTRRAIREALVIGCIDYVFSTSTVHHQTGFIFQVRYLHEGFPLGLTVGEPVSQSDVAFVPFYFGGRLSN